MNNPQDYLDEKQVAKSWWNTLTYMEKSARLIYIRGNNKHELMCSVLPTRISATTNEILKLYKLEQNGENNPSQST